MKKNNIFTIFAAAGLMAMLAAGCQKDTVMLTASISSFGGDSKTVIGNDVWPDFVVGDEICINQIGNGLLGGNPVAGQTGRNNIPVEVEHADTYHAVYPAEYVTGISGNTFSLDLPRVQRFDTNADGQQIIKVPMGAIDDGAGHLPFTNLGTLLAITVTNNIDSSDLEDCIIDSIQVIASSAGLCGSAVVEDITSPERCVKTLSRGKNTVSLVGSNGGSMNVHLDRHATSRTYYVSLPYISDEVDNRYTIKVFLADDEFTIRYTKTQANAYSGCIPLSYYSRVPFPLTENPIKIPKDIDGLYSIGVAAGSLHYVNGKLQYDTIKVDFAPMGNLQAYVDANGNPIEWRFAPNQWDILNVNTYPNYSNSGVSANIGVTEGWVDLFNHNLVDASGAHITNYGLSINDTESFYYYRDSITYHTNTRNYASGANIRFRDWGLEPDVIDAIGHNWMTLSNGEWGFLLGYTTNNVTGTRENNEERFSGESDYGDVTVHGAIGCVFLPDFWHATGSLADLTPVDREGKISFLSSYTDEQWEIMEEAGAIFLPSNPCRLGNGYLDLETNAKGGLYMTSDWQPAHPIHNHNHSYETGTTELRYGYAVRLAYLPVRVHHEVDADGHEHTIITPVQIDNYHYNESHQAARGATGSNAGDYCLLVHDIGDPIEQAPRH